MNATRVLLALSILLNAVLGAMLWRTLPRESLVQHQTPAAPPPVQVPMIEPKLDALNPPRIDVSEAGDLPSPKLDLTTGPAALADPRTRKGVGVSLIKASGDDEPGDPEFRRPNIMWQTPPRPDLKPGRSTPFSRPDWDQHPVLRQGFDPPAVSHDPSS